MALSVQEITGPETDLIIDYFQSATPEYLEMLGVDPTRLPPAQSWRERMRPQRELPIDQRSTVLVVWLADDQPIGFSTADKIQFGEQATCIFTSSTPIAAMAASAPNACASARTSISTGSS